MGIFKNGREIQSIYHNGRLINYVYRNGRKIFGYLKYCFSLGYWTDSYPWGDDSSWID